MEEQNSGYDSTNRTTNENSDNFENQARNSANEFREGWNQVTHNQENKKVLAGILAIVIGSLGVHKFILGYTQEGIIQIVANICTCGIASIIPFIEGILYLFMSDKQFDDTYVFGRKPWL